jgi:hypothetical protein
MLFVNIASDQDRQALAQLTQFAVGRVAQPARAVIRSNGQASVKEIAARLHSQPKGLRECPQRYTQGGCSPLFDLPRRGRPTKLHVIARQAVFCQINQPPATSGYLFALRGVATPCQHLASRGPPRLSRWRLRQVLAPLRYRFRRPKIAPRKADPRRQEIHQQVGRRIAEGRSETAALVKDETDVRLFPVRRRMRMRIGQQVKHVAPMKNQGRPIFGSLGSNSGEVFHRIYRRERTVEMISYLEGLPVHYAGRPVLLILDHASIHKSRALRAWRLEDPQVELRYLPESAAHRDKPIKKLWRHLKGDAAADRCCR